MFQRGALQGVKVLDLTRILAGPYCSMLLADMGADVIKIEKPHTGDDSRANYPMKNGESVYYINLNRNKRGITLNLKSEEGKDIFRRMVKKADIVLENFRPGVMDRLGLGYENLREINPAIVYGCISGYGHYGPYRDRPGYDIIAQAMGGMMSTTGWPGGPPTRCGTAIGDVMGGISLCVGVEAAYISRLQTGYGQKVDVALVDSIVSAMEIINMIYLVEGRVPQRIGNRYEAAFPYDTFQAKDGQIVIAAGNERLFSILCRLMKREDLKEDERFCTNVQRVRHALELKPIIEDWLKDYSVTEAVSLIEGNGIPSAPIYDIEQVVNDPHISGAREMFVDIDHPIAGKMKITGSQIKMSETPATIRFPAPLLGQYTKEVMSEFGIDEEEFNVLKTRNVF